MARPATDSKDKILIAACELIAQKGFHVVTHQDICTRANVNTALINYYFGSKDKLYEAVWEHALNLISAARFDAISELPKTDRLPAIIANRLWAVFDESPNGWFLRIVHHEMTRPSSMGPMLREKYLVPIKKRLLELVWNFLGPEATDTDAQCGLLGIHAVCVQLNIMRHHRKSVFEDGVPEDPNAIVQRLTSFAMGGLRELRKTIDERGESS
jgi:AcrR family transcriptional regulator